MKKIIKIVLIAAVVLFGLNFFKNASFAWLLSTGLSRASHVPVSIGSTDLRFSSSAITLKNIRLGNPPAFPERTMLDAPLVGIQFDVPAFFKGTLHFKEVKLDLKEIVVIRNKKGDLNVSALKPTEEHKPKKETKLQIDKLYLTIGQVVYKDYSMGDKPMVQTFNINIQNRQYTNITDPGALISTIMFESLTRTTLSQIANLDLGSFKNDASGILSQGLDILGSGGGTVTSKAKDILSLFK